MSDFWTVLLGGAFAGLVAWALGFVGGYVKGTADERGAFWDHGKPLYIIRSSEYQPPAGAPTPTPTPEEVRAFRARLLGAMTEQNAQHHDELLRTNEHMPPAGYDKVPKTAPERRF